MLESLRILLASLALLGGTAAIASEVEIVRVDFDLEQQDGARDPWYAISVVLSVAEGERGAEGNPRFADDITVSLALATEVNRGSGRAYEFYAAKADYPSLEVGQHVARFYLPPEIVKRDRVRGEPFAYEIELLSREGLKFALVSPNLERPGALQSFRSKVAAGAAGSSELRLQHQTPFAWLYPRNTPNPRLGSQ
ncbi:hypothetical protein IEN85_13880 [Pelagicoccus sp. NFK12]|uniref:Uncharacterized protein n=1 Tax=Pelagicoccus enzymogenes TaxID=2773457 RepID=A0A927IHU7_9BACT|nr:hypothetical protein [Pelagicoccus enzymogenes]MBD5780586.1 hypothetical protein [Pelagicoccus enzymogenes]